MKIHFKNNISNLIIALIALLSLNSCKSIISNQMFETDANYKFSEFKPSEKEYKIQPFDKIDVKIYANDGFKLVDLAQQNTQMPLINYTIEYDGNVKLPTIGRINLAGKTIREAELFLEEKYKAFFVDPFVLVHVTNKRIVVFAGGASTGKVIPLQNDNYTLIEALAEAGGISDFSKSHRIKLLRGDLTNPQIFLFNIRDLKDMQNANFVLQSNDIIYVESRPKYASRILVEITPYLTLMSSALLIYGLFIR